MSLLPAIIRMTSALAARFCAVAIISDSVICGLRIAADATTLLLSRRRIARTSRFPFDAIATFLPAGIPASCCATLSGRSSSFLSAAVSGSVATGAFSTDDFETDDGAGGSGSGAPGSLAAAFAASCRAASSLTLAPVSPVSRACASSRLFSPTQAIFCRTRKSNSASCSARGRLGFCSNARTIASLRWQRC